MPDTTPLNLSATGDLNIGGDVVGRDKIVQHITQIYERAKTAVEEAAQAQAAEAKMLAEGVLAVAARLQARASDTSTIAGTNPYKGLLEYRLSDAELFFGRERAIRELLQQLERSSLTILHSESGAGKTSLLQAGLAPRLLAHAHLPLYLRPYNSEPQYVIKRAFISDPSLTPELSTAPLRDFLRRVTDVLGKQRYLFICLDQFEEFFTQLSAPEREEFVRELAECMDDATLNVRWILALRTEYFGNLANFRPRIQNPFENDFRLNRLTREEAQVVMTAPAERVGLRYEAGLVENILDDLGQKEIAPPQMQLVCSALFEELKPEEKVFTKELYEREGRAAGILRGHLERVLSRDLPGPQRASARRLLESLISSEQQRVVRTHTELVAELSAKGVTPQTLDVILNQLVNSRLLRPHESESGEVSYELSHDYLLSEINLDPDVQARKAAQELLEQEVRAFRRYQTLLTAERLNVIEPYTASLTLTTEAKQLLTDSRTAVQKEKLEEEARRQKELEDARKLAESEKQRAEERTRAAQSLQTRNRLVTGVGIVAGVLAVIAFVLFGQANSAREEANTQRNVAITQQAIAVTEQARAEAEARRAETEAQRAEEEARQARIGLAGQFAAQAQTALSEDAPQAATLLAIEALNVTRRTGEPDVRQAQNALKSALFASDSVGLGDESTLSPDGRWLAVYVREANAIRLYGTEGEAPTTPVTGLALPNEPAHFLQFQFSADNGWLFATLPSETETRLVGWRLDSDVYPFTDFGGLATHTTAEREPFLISPDGHWMLSQTAPPTLYDLTLADPAAAPLPLRQAPTEAQYQFSTNSLWLIATKTEYDFTQTQALLVAWALNAPNPSVPRLVQNNPQTENGLVALSPATNTLAFAFTDLATQTTPLYVYDLTAINPHQTLVAEDVGAIGALALAGRWALTQDFDGTFLKLWEWANPAAPALEIRGTEANARVQTWRLSPNERWLAVSFAQETRLGTPTKSASVLDLALENPLAAPAHTFTGEEASDAVFGKANQPTFSLPTYYFQFSPDAHYLLVTEDDVALYAYDLLVAAPFAQNLPLVTPLIQKGAAELGGTYTFSLDGRWLALGFETGYLWDLTQLSPTTALLESVHLRGTPVAFSPNSEWLVLSQSEGPWTLYDLQTQIELPITGHDTTLFSATFTQQSNALISQDNAGFTRWWELARAPVGHQPGPVSEDRRLALTLRGTRAFLWPIDQPTLPPPTIFEHGGAHISQAALSPDNAWLATYATDEQLRLWDLTAPRPAAAPLFAWPLTLDEETGITQFTFSANGQWFMVGTNAGAWLWATAAFAGEGASNVQPALTLPATFFAERLTQDGRWLLGSDVGPVAYDLSKAEPSAIRLNTEKGISATSADGRWLALVNFFQSASEPPGVELRDLHALPATETVLADELFVQDGAFSPDSRWLAFYGGDETTPNIAYIYSLGETAQRHAALTNEIEMIGQAFTPDGNTYLRFFSTQALLTRLAEPEAEPIPLQNFFINSVIFPIIYQADITLDSRWLAFNDFGGVRVWDLTEPDQPALELGPAPNAVALKYSAGGHWLVIQDNNHVRFISLNVEALLARACASAGRNLSVEEWARYAPGQPYRTTCPQWAAKP